MDYRITKTLATTGKLLLMILLLFLDAYVLGFMLFFEKPSGLAIWILTYVWLVLMEYSLFTWLFRPRYLKKTPWASGTWIMAAMMVLLAVFFLYKVASGTHDMWYDLPHYPDVPTLRYTINTSIIITLMDINLVTLLVGLPVELRNRKKNKNWIVVLATIVFIGIMIALQILFKPHGRMVG